MGGVNFIVCFRVGGIQLSEHFFEYDLVGIATHYEPAYDPCSGVMPGFS